MRIKGLVVFLLWVSHSYGQTCCSGGVPMSSNLGFDGAENNVLYSSFSWDYNYLNTLQEGTKTIDDNSRQRITNSFLVQLGYGITDRLSIDALGSIVQQRRLITQANGFSDQDNTLGIGDLIALIKYQVLPSSNLLSLNAGVGLKAPLGKYDIKDTDGIFYSADLQPGSGSWDFVYRLQSSFTPNATAPWSIHSSLIFSDKTTNKDYLRIDDSYTFGDELQFQLGYAHQLFIYKQIIDLSINMRYRKAWQDSFNRNVLPATGGNWVFVSPGFIYWIDPSLAISVQLTLPLYANVIETQLTPTIRTSLGIKKNLKF